MIGTIVVNISAENPIQKLTPFRAFVGSPSTVRISGVPKQIGDCKIQTVYVTVNYPDNRSVGKACKLSGGALVATVEGSTLPGKSLLGYSVKADGVDEDGNPVIGYVLGKGDVEICDADATLTPGETTHYIHVLESRPETPNKGDAYVENGTWRFYNGTEWTVLGGVSAGNSYVMAPVESGGDGLWHRMIIVDGAIAFEREGIAEPPLAADKPWVSNQIAAETERAQGAEQANADAIAAEAERAQAAEQANVAAIAAETERAQGAEQANADAIAAETERAKAAEQANAAAIAAETERAKAAEQANNTAIASESGRAQGVEAVLNSALTNEIARAGAAEESAVHKSGDEPVSGIKTFTDSPIIPDAPESDTSGKSASTSWVVKKIASWWNAVKSAAVSFGSTVTASGGFVGDLTGHASRDALDSAVVHKTGNETISGSKTFSTDIINIRDGNYVNHRARFNGLVRGESPADAKIFSVQIEDETGKPIVRILQAVYTSGNRSIELDAATDIGDFINLATFTMSPDGSIITAKGSCLAKVSMPGGTSLTLKLPESGQMIEFASGVNKAPKSGWLVLQMKSSAVNQYASIAVLSGANSAICFETRNMSNSAADTIMLSAPVSKGDSVRLNYSLGGAVDFIRFNYCEAEV